MKIGYAIRFCRQQKRLSIPALAKRAGMSASHLSLIERDKREPSFGSLDRICRELAVPMSMLIFLGSEPSEMTGISDDVREKLSDVVLKLLRLSTDDSTRPAIV